MDKPTQEQALEYSRNGDRVGFLIHELRHYMTSGNADKITKEHMDALISERVRKT